GASDEDTQDHPRQADLEEDHLVAGWPRGLEPEPPQAPQGHLGQGARADGGRPQSQRGDGGAGQDGQGQGNGDGGAGAEPGARLKIGRCHAVPSWAAPGAWTVPPASPPSSGRRWTAGVSTAG